ncbi:hypothetical protein ACTFIY_007946 [Dictyostelium cf. discoideum]
MKILKFILILCLLTLNIVSSGDSIESSKENNNTISSSLGSTNETSLDSSTINNNNITTYTNYTCTENESCKLETEVCLKTFGSYDGGGDGSKDKKSDDNCNCNCDCECHKKNNSTTSSTSNKTNCVPRESLKITLLPTLINSWDNFTQFDITIENGSDRNIKQIYIGYDESLSLRDDQSLWNMVISDSKENILILPQYQQTINSMSNYTFGYIKSGNNPAQLIINEIIFE